VLGGAHAIDAVGMQGNGDVDDVVARRDVLARRDCRFTLALLGANSARANSVDATTVRANSVDATTVRANSVDANSVRATSVRATELA
jgi:hypothetical protein